MSRNKEMFVFNKKCKYLFATYNFEWSSRTVNLLVSEFFQGFLWGFLAVTGSTHSNLKKIEIGS